MLEICYFIFNNEFENELFKSHSSVPHLSKSDETILSNDVTSLTTAETSLSTDEINYRPL